MFNQKILLQTFIIKTQENAKSSKNINKLVLNKKKILK